MCPIGLAVHVHVHVEYKDAMYRFSFITKVLIKNPISACTGTADMFCKNFYLDEHRGFVSLMASPCVFPRGCDLGTRLRVHNQTCIP